jgi:tRNA threonylcarbamoyladenosine biosynthesis protein TsaB
MLILALDTTSEAGGAAIFDDEICLAEIAHQGAANEYSVALFEMTERLVAMARAQEKSSLMSLADIDLYAVANGPGSFTGIRVGVAAAQAWAKVFGKPVKGVSTLEALAESAQLGTENSLAILNAYRGEFYVGEFQKSVEGRFVASGDGRVANAEALGDFASRLSGADASWTHLVRAHDKAALALRDVLGGQLRWQIVEGTLLSAIARLGRHAALEGRLDPPGQLDACYIRRTDAELSWKE